MLLSTSLGFAGYENETFLNSKPRRIGRGASSAPGFEKILGCTEKNLSKSVMNIAWSAITEKVEKKAWMFVLAPGNRSC